MNCLCSLGRWNHRFESYSRSGCLYVHLFCVCVVLYTCISVEALRRAVHSPKEYYHLCKKIMKLKKRPGPNERAVEPSMNEWINFWLDIQFELEIGPMKESLWLQKDCTCAKTALHWCSQGKVRGGCIYALVFLRVIIFCRLLFSLQFEKYVFAVYKYSEIMYLGIRLSKL
jgi:hypothetical protein